MWQFLKTLWQSPKPDRPLVSCMKLYEAVRHRDELAVRQALDAGADPNRLLAMDETGQVITQPDSPATVMCTALHLAIDQGELRLVQLLLSRGAVVAPEDTRLAVQRLNQRTDGTIGPRGQVLLALAAQPLDFQAKMGPFSRQQTLAQLIQAKQPALAVELGLAMA